MARKRSVSPDFWTWEAVIDCAAMTRLLFIGLWNFADDFGVQPLRPRTIRLQVLPGDAIDDAAMRAMIDELVARGLVRIYEADGQAYLAIVDWEHMQRVGKRAKRRYPPSPREGQAPRTAPREKAPSVGEADEGLSPTMANHCIAEAGGAAADTIANHCIIEPAGSPPSPSGPSVAPDLREEKGKEWRAAIEARLRRRWPDCPPLDEGAEQWISQWLDDRCDLQHDVLEAVETLHRPPVGLHEIAAQVSVFRSWRRVAA